MWHRLFSADSVTHFVPEGFSYGVPEFVAVPQIAMPGLSGAQEFSIECGGDPRMHCKEVPDLLWSGRGHPLPRE